MTIQSKPFTWLFALLFIVAISILGIQLRAIHNAAGTLGKVKVEGGYISGTLNAADDVYIFKGIPFAAPPVGDLRWRAPGPVKPWSGVRKCDAFGPSPMQGKPAPFSMWSTEFLIPAEPISEDCLYLNVWTGAQTSQEKRPVLVWIYGGGFVSGGSGVPIYDGEAMAKKGVVFVSINYRVGIFAIDYPIRPPCFR
jgi:para-nitrobenzyl esterase